MVEPGEEREESKKIVYTYPLVENCNMSDEAMELCVTTCEKTCC